MRNYFIFLPDSGGMIDSRELSIHIEHLPDIQRAPERVEYIVVPGRSGTLTKTEGENVYDSYTKSFDIVALDKEKIPSIHRLLRGNGKIIFSNELQFRYTVSITDGWSFNRFFRQWHRATLSMETQPFKESVEEKVNRGTWIQDLPVGGGAGCYLELNVNTDVHCPFFGEFGFDDYSTIFVIKLNEDQRLNSIVNSSHENATAFMDNEKGLFYTDEGGNVLKYTVRESFPMYFAAGKNTFSVRNATEMIVRYRGRFL